MPVLVTHAAFMHRFMLCLALLVWASPYMNDMNTVLVHKVCMSIMHTSTVMVRGGIPRPMCAAVLHRHDR